MASMKLKYAILCVEDVPAAPAFYENAFESTDASQAQTTAYVTDPDGFLVEICSPVAPAELSDAIANQQVLWRITHQRAR